jgi:hypothetical protein
MMINETIKGIDSGCRDLSNTYMHFLDIKAREKDWSEPEPGAADGRSSHAPSSKRHSRDLAA